MVEYGSVGVRHFQHLADMANLSDDALRAHVSQLATALGQSHKDVSGHLRQMLLAHAEEWRAFLFAQGEKSFLRRWVDGGRNGGLE